jgi:DNA-binding PadR family transcriptional regulator
MYREHVTTTFRRSPLALAILGLLENGPMHPYGIQRLIKQWGKDKVINVGQRASLYRMIDRLEDAQLITAVGTDRDERYPERTTYHLTEAGRAASRQWLTEILSTPRNEYPEFPAALSFIMLLSPRTAEDVLVERRTKLAHHIAELDRDLASDVEGVERVEGVEGAEGVEGVEGVEIPPIALAEIEYLRAVTDAELRWVTTTLEALHDGTLTWIPAEPASPGRT